MPRGRKQIHEVKEDLDPEMLLKGVEKIKGIDESVIDLTGSRYYLQQLFEDMPDLETHIKVLQLILRNAKKEGYTRVNMGVSYDSDGCYDSGEVDVDPVGWRPETDEERKARLTTAKKRREAAKWAAERRKAQKAKRERDEYERLKAKFERKAK